MNYLISGGGTGGHIFPAVSIANALRELDTEANILFVGALGRMEMERVPQAGYRIIGLPVRGFFRSRPWRNIPVLIDLLRSMRQARKIIRDFRPDVGVGVGGYASGAAMKVAAKMGVPIVLQEQNGFAGVTNKLLRNDAQLICVAYDGMERFFPADKLLLTGNPVRQNLTSGTKAGAIEWLKQEYSATFDASRPTLLVIGGSLGARTVNEAIIAALPQLLADGIQVIWQTGKTYYDDLTARLASLDLPRKEGDGWIHSAFIANMPDAYALATLVVSRAGASSISELCLLGKASILVPSPNVAEDHQTHNAMALVRHDAAILIKDKDATEQLGSTILQTISDNARIQTLSGGALSLAQTDSATRIAREVIRIAQSRKN